MSAGTVMHHYNPDWLSDEDLVAGFVARQGDFSFLREELAQTPCQGNTQHYLLVGVRGSGKTTLLKRLAVAIRKDGDLLGHLIAVSFPEELYQVKNLADFWQVACENLIDEFDRLGMEEEANQLQNDLDHCPGGGDQNPLSDQALQLLLKACATLDKRPVLLVDNLDMILQRIGSSGRKKNDPHSPAYWAFREALSTNASPVIIGSSVRLSEPFTNHDRAFYDFFVPKRLSKLDLADVERVLRHLAQARNLPDIQNRIEEHPGRIKALHELTGGNPRALGLIFEILRNGPNGRAIEDFKQLMDITTPYYKARFEDLADQAQVVMHGLAVCRFGLTGLCFGHTAAKIGEHSGLQTRTVSAQLDILVREGLVEKNGDYGRTQYRIAEQLFRLWLQMRGSRRIRKNVIGLTEFLEALYEPEELKQCLLMDGQGSPLSQAQIAFAVADTRHAGEMRYGFMAHGTDATLQHAWQQGGEVEAFLHQGDLPESLKELADLRDRLHRSQQVEMTEEEMDWLIGSLWLEHADKKKAVQALCCRKSSRSELSRLQSLQEQEYAHLQTWGLLSADLPLFYRKRARGFLPLPRLTPDDAKNACLNEQDDQRCRGMIWRVLGMRRLIQVNGEEDAGAWILWGKQHQDTASPDEWANVAGTMRLNRCFSTAELALLQSEQRGASARGLYEKAVWLMDIAKDYPKAEKIFQKAIELDPKYHFPWFNLGELLHVHLERPEDAANAYAEGTRLVEELHPYWRRQYVALQTRLAVDRAKEAVEGKNSDLLKTILKDLVHESVDLAAALVNKAFIKDFLSWVLNEHEDVAPTLLSALRNTGFARHARPLLLAFEVAVTKRDKILKDLEPEVQKSVQEIFKRLKARS